MAFTVNSQMSMDFINILFSRVGAGKRATIGNLASGVRFSFQDAFSRANDEALRQTVQKMQARLNAPMQQKTLSMAVGR
jgi:hypothetical protein